jgi:hypothetical protein
LDWAEAASDGADPLSADDSDRRICDRASAADGLVVACAEEGAIRTAVLGAWAAWLRVTWVAAG